MRVRLLLLAVTLLLPGASACSWATPDLLETIAWHPSLGIVGTSELFWKGRVDLENGTLRSGFPADALFAPDGRSAAFARVGPDVQTGPRRIDDTCGFHVSRHLVGWDLPTNTFAIVDEGPVWSMGARDDGVVTYRERETRVFRWGSWEPIETVPGATGAQELSWRPSLRHPALVALEDDDVYTWDAVVNGEHIAVVAEDAANAQVRIYRHVDMELLAVDDLGHARARLAWQSDAGLAAWIEPLSGSATPALRVYREPLALGSPQERAFAGERPGGLAWSPAADRIAVSLLHGQERGRLVVLDASTLEIEESRDIELDPVEGERLPGLGSVPIPEYSLVEKVEATPAPDLASLAVALALAVALSRRG